CKPKWRMTTDNNDVAGDRAGFSFSLVDFHDIFKGQWLEVLAVCGVVVGGHRLRVAVNHDGFITLTRQLQCGVDTEIVKLDTLANAVRARAQEDRKSVV